MFRLYIPTLFTLITTAYATQNHIYLVAPSAIGTQESGNIIPTAIPISSDGLFTATMTYAPSASATTFFIGNARDPSWYTASCVVSATASPVLNPTFYVDAEHAACFRLGTTVTHAAAGCSCTKAEAFAR